MNKSIRRISAAAQQKLLTHHWPGNVRELRNVIERAVILETTEEIHPANLPAAFFDLSSGIAGEYLQKWRNYRIRVAVLAPPGSITPSSRFPEMVAEEARRGHFRIFETREPAVEWLDEIGDEAGGG